MIKIERPDTGDICRQLYVSNVVLDGESSVFHAINRNKQSFAADLKAADAAKVRELITKADIVMHNFRPGVMERLGFDYESVREIKGDIIYGEISGYGKKQKRNMEKQTRAGSPAAKPFWFDLAVETATMGRCHWDWPSWTYWPDCALGPRAACRHGSGPGCSGDGSSGSQHVSSLCSSI